MVLRSPALVLGTLLVFTRVSLAAQCPDGSLPPCRPAAPRSGGPTRSGVAVLYFDNLSRDSTYAYLADGLTEELILKLGGVGQLDVRSRFAVRRYKGRLPDDPAAVGRALDVTYLVSGSVRPGRDRVRVTVEVVRTTTGARVWSGELDRPSGDLLAVTDEVAQVVAHGIVGRLAPGEEAALATRATQSPQAYEHFIRANYAIALRTPRAVLQALDEYQTALRLDPGYTAARARTAYAYAMLYAWDWSHPTLPAESLLARGVGEAEQALQQDSTSSDAWMAYGMLHWFLAPYDGVVSLLAHARSVALDPDNAEAHQLLGMALMNVGRNSDAAAAFQRALAIEPGRPITLLRLSEISWMAHDYDGARRLLDTLIAASPGFYNAYEDRVALLLQAGDTTAARKDAELCYRLAPDDYVPTRATLAWVQVVEGDTAHARHGMDSVLALVDRKGDDLAPWLSLVLPPVLALGDTARALEYVERAGPRGAYLWALLRWPTLEPLLPFPRYQRVMEESRPPGATLVPGTSLPSH